MKGLVEYLAKALVDNPAPVEVFEAQPALGRLLGPADDVTPGGHPVAVLAHSLSVTMLHLTGLFRADAAIQSSGERMKAKYFSAEDLSSFGMDVHAGVGETSGILAIRPDLVSPDYTTSPSQAGRKSSPASRSASSRCSR